MQAAYSKVLLYAVFASARKKQEYGHGALENKKLRIGSYFFTKDSNTKLYFGKMHIFTIFWHNESCDIDTAVGNGIVSLRKNATIHTLPKRGA